MLSFSLVVEALVLTIALSTDALMSGFAYGANKIKLPFLSVVLVSFICSLILGISLCLGTWLSKYIPSNITLIICVVILVVLGLVKVMDSYIKKIIKKNQGINKNLEFSLFNIKLTLNLYAKPEEADFDKSKVLSLKESIAIAIALSIDSLTIGFGAGLFDTSFLKITFILLFSFVFGILTLLIGSKIGSKLADKFNLSWLSGVILIAIAIFKIITQ